MFVHCELCGYDSGDRDTDAELAEKVRSDGGKWESAQDRPGVEITCPAGHTGDSIHLD
jgi:hypothetical protein